MINSQIGYSLKKSPLINMHEIYECIYKYGALLYHDLRVMKFWWQSKEHLSNSLSNISGDFTEIVRSNIILRHTRNYRCLNTRKK